MKPSTHCADCQVLVDEDYATAPLPTTTEAWEDLADEHARYCPWIKRVWPDAPEYDGPEELGECGNYAAELAERMDGYRKLK